MYFILLVGVVYLYHYHFTVQAPCSYVTKGAIQILVIIISTQKVYRKYSKCINDYSFKVIVL